MRRRSLLALLTLAVALAAGLFGLRGYALRRLERELLITRPQGTRTPGTVGLAFEEVRIGVGGRTLNGFWVAPPPGPRPAAVIVFHGRQESISSWVPVQRLLFDGGVGSLVFDYTGFGRSTGTPSLARLQEDAPAAWAAFRARLPPGARACAYGLSLGTGVLLEAAPALRPAPDCLVVYGSFTSALGPAVARGTLPAWLLPLFPDALESLRNAARVPAPLLVEHGLADELTPPEGARRIAAAAPGSRLLLLPGYTHAQPLVAPDATAWQPVIAFIRGEPVP